MIKFEIIEAKTLLRISVGKIRPYYELDRFTKPNKLDLIKNIDKNREFNSLKDFCDLYDTTIVASKFDTNINQQIMAFNIEAGLSSGTSKQKILDYIKNIPLMPNCVLHGRNGNLQLLYLANSKTNQNIKSVQKALHMILKEFFEINTVENGILISSHNSIKYKSIFISDDINKKFYDNAVESLNFITNYEYSDRDKMESMKIKKVIKNMQQNHYKKTTNYDDLLIAEDSFNIIKDFDISKIKCLNLQLDFNEVSNEDKVITISNLVNFNKSKIMISGKYNNAVNKAIQASIIKNNVFNLSCSNCSKKCACKSLYNTDLQINLKSKIFSSLDVDFNKKTEPIAKGDIDKLRSELKNILTKVRKSEKGSINLIKVPTGGGKTFAAMKELAESSVLAFPNHQLKSEKINEYINLYSDKPFESLNVKDFLSEEDYETITNIYKIEGYYSASNFIKSRRGGKEWLRKNNLPLSKRTFTTHEKSLVTKFNTNVRMVAYDEDPVNSLFKTSTFKKTKVLSELDEIYEIIADSKKGPLLSLINAIKSIDKRSDFKRNPLSKKEIKYILDKVYKNKKIISATTLNLIGSFIISNETFASVRELPSQTIVILSATIDTDFYEKYYKDRKVNVYEIEMELLGELNQVKIPTGKVNFNKNKYLKKQIAEIAELAGADDIITYKKYASEMNFDEHYKIYMGNTSGYNSLSGKNTVVAATFRKPEQFYILKHIAKLNFNNKNNKNKTKLTLPNTFSKSTMGVKNGKHYFKFFTFLDTGLRKTQLDDINSEMVQAIGRSRLLLNKDVETVVISDFVPDIIKSENIFERKEYLKLKGED